MRKRRRMEEGDEFLQPTCPLELMRRDRVRKGEGTMEDNKEGRRHNGIEI